MTEDSDIPEGLAKNKEELIEKLQKANIEPPCVSHALGTWYDDKGNFNPALLAEDISRSYDIKTDIETDILYFYDSARGVYDRNGDMRLRYVVEKCLDKENRRERTAEVLFLVHVKTQDKIQPSHKIAVENGFLNPETGELERFGPQEFIINKLPIRYDKKATCPETDKFFNEVAPSDLKPQFEELFGYCLLLANPIHKATVLLGEGRNGKTTFLNLLTAFLGPENVSHVTLQQICNGKFEIAELKDKLANICDDLPGNALKTVGMFKWITGNSPISAQYKHKNPFTFWPTAKHLFACNKLPAPSEDTIAYYSRFNIIPFTKLFIGKTDDKKELKKLTTPSELSGLLNLALAGLKRIMENGDFTNSKTIEENRELYIKSSDSCKAFVEDQLEETDDPKDIIATETVYQMYVIYCRDNRLPKIESKSRLTEAIRQTYANVDHSKQRIGTATVWVWRYLKSQKCSSVPDVPGVYYKAAAKKLEEFKDKNNIEGPEQRNIGTEPELSINKEPKSEAKTAGHCFHWHKRSCTITRRDPDARYDCLSPLNLCGEDCPDYTESQP